jgi:hypothetical protein
MGQFASARSPGPVRLGQFALDPFDWTRSRGHESGPLGTAHLAYIGQSACQAAPGGKIGDIALFPRENVPSAD